MKRASLTGIIATLCLLAALAGCKRTSNQVVAYTSVDQVFSEPVFTRAGTAQGLVVKAVFDTEETKSTGVVNRLIAEAAQPRADVFWSGDPARPFLLVKRGLVEPYISPAAAGIPDAFKASDGTWTGFAARARVFLINKRKVPAEGRPTSLGDLAAPKWKGQAAIANPAFGTTTMHMAALFAAWGDQRGLTFLDDLKKNDVRIASSNGEVKRLVVAGEVAFGLTDTDDAHEAIKDDAPVAVVYPDQDGAGTLVMPTTVVLLKGGPNPAAARKLIDHLISAEVEKAMATAAAHMPLRKGVESPAQVKTLADIKAMPVDYAKLGDTMERIGPMLRAWAGM